MKAEIIAIGSELTCGARLDTNSQWLSRELEALGWTVQRHTTVADDRAAMVRIYREAAQRSRVVLVTGGLGPTLDDITRETLAEAFHQQLVQDDNALAFIEQMFRSRGRVMPERNKVQALRPEYAVTIHNAHGTAPGILLNLDEPACVVAAMPGVPAEMKRMFHEQIVCRLPRSDVYVRRSVIRTFGFGESDVEQRLGDLTARGRNPEVGITASQAVISLSITARAGSEAECDLLTNEVREEIKARLGNAVFGEGEIELHQVVAEQLGQMDVRIAILEGISTGGLISHMLTENDDIAHRIVDSRLYSETLGNVASPVTDAQWKSTLLQHGQEMLASGQADYVLVSSPSAIADEAGVRTRRGHVLVVGPGVELWQDVSMAGNLAIFRQRAARSALNQLRCHLMSLASQPN